MAESEIDQMLIDAATAGDNIKILQALKDGADIHANSDIAFRLAVENNHTKTAKLLLDQGADIHALNDLALRMAATNGHTAMVELLLKGGADMHVENNWVLHAAVALKKKETAITLLHHGADLKVKNFLGKDSLQGTDLGAWMEETRQAASEYFTSAKLNYNRCFSPDEKGEMQLCNRVLDTFVTSQFTSLIAAPLIASADKSDRQLFQDIWDAMPPYWQDQNQNLYMQFAKEGGLNPIVGSQTALVQRDSLSPVSRMGR